MIFRVENGFLSRSQTRSVGTEFEELELVDAIDKSSSKDYIFEDIPTNVLSQAESSVMLIENRAGRTVATGNKYGLVMRPWGKS